jgi:hypothetical protein
MGFNDGEINVIFQGRKQWSRFHSTPRNGEMPKEQRQSCGRSDISEFSIMSGHDEGTNI